MSDGVDARIGPGARVRGCPPPDQLQAMAGDALPDALRSEVATHLAVCPACQALTADLALLEPELPTSLLKGPARRPAVPAGWLAAAAAALAVVGLGIWWQAHAPAGQVATVATPAPPVVSAAVTAPPGQWTVDPPALGAPPLSAIIVMRGSGNPGLYELMEAIAPYRAGNFAEASRSLDAYTRTHPKVADGWFFLGASRLLSGQSQSARPAFAEFARLTPGARRDETAWLDATAAARSGAIVDARKTLSALCNQPGAFKARACDALNTLP